MCKTKAIVETKEIGFLIRTKLGGVYKMAQDVLCEVNNCKFWAKGNKCSADEIYVVSHTGKQAEKQEETDCKTFDPGI